MKPSVQGKQLAVLILGLMIAGCSGERPRISATFNENASLAGQPPSNPLQWKVITSEINTVDSTMSTLYGNEFAVSYARTNPQHSYPPGAVLSMVTWTQRPDERYFGAKIPDHVKSVEYIFVKGRPDGQPVYFYQKLEGVPLRGLAPALQADVPSGRMAYILSQRASVMP